MAEVGLLKTDDIVIVEFARNNGFSIITFDLYFSRIMALGDLALPSIITFRMDLMTSDKFHDFMAKLIPMIEKDLATGCMVTVSERHLRIRRLPV